MVVVIQKACSERKQDQHLIRNPVILYKNNTNYGQLLQNSKSNFQKEIPSIPVNKRVPFQAVLKDLRRNTVKKKMAQD